MNRTRRSFCFLGALLVAGCATTTPDPRTDAIAELGAAGKLRAAINFADMEYTAPYVIIEGAYLVRNNSPLQRNEDVDRAGTHVAVGRGSAYDLWVANS